MHGRWPPGKRCAVGLSFDFDAETIWFRTLRQPFAGQMSRGEYGAREGVPRILDLLQRYDLKASFFVPGWTADKYPQLVERMHAAGHENRPPRLRARIRGRQGRGDRAGGAEQGH